MSVVDIFFSLVSGREYSHKNLFNLKFMFICKNLLVDKTKTAYDCYSLHDRMKQKYKTYENIVQNLV